MKLSIPTSEEEIEAAVKCATSKDQLVKIVDEMDRQYCAGSFSCADEFWPKLTRMVGDRLQELENQNT